MNSATKISTVLILTLSLLCCVEANTEPVCNVCELARNSKCLRNRSQCQAKEGELCSSISYYDGSRHLFSKQSCLKDCKEMEITENNRLILKMCCNKNLCNSF